MIWFSRRYLAFGPDVSSNVLLELPRNAVGGFARLGMVVVVLGVYLVRLAFQRLSEGKQSSSLASL